MDEPRLAAVVMAGGLSTRMNSAIPKHLHPLLGRRLIDWVLAAVRTLEPVRHVLVTSPAAQSALVGSLPDDIELAVQPEARGTGDAVALTEELLYGHADQLLVVPGDVPLLTAELLRGLLSAHRAPSAATLLSFDHDDAGRYGRIVRDAAGRLERIVEAADATDEQLAIREVSSSIYVFALPRLWAALSSLGSANAQGEAYLTDVIELIAAEGEPVTAHRVPWTQFLEGVNTQVELSAAAAALRDRVNAAHMLAGVTIIDPASTWIDADVEIEPDAVIHPFTVLRGASTVGAGAHVGPHAVMVGASAGAGAHIGPFAYLRPGAQLARDAKAGTFVEVKNSRIGRGTKVPHLSYIGDAEIGEETNIGAGAITANYRPELGGTKERTTIGDNVHTGSHNVFVAPVEIGDGAWVAAGSTVTEDVPPGSLAIARSHQINQEGYREREQRE